MSDPTIEDLYRCGIMQRIEDIEKVIKRMEDINEILQRIEDLERTVY